MRCGCPADTSAKQKHRPSRQARPPSGVRQSVFPFQMNKSSCARAAQAPYFCTDRNREKNRRTPFRSGFRTFLFERTVYKRSFLIKLHLRSQQTAKGVSPFETPAQAERIVIRFVLNLRNKKALIPVKHYGDIKALGFY